jgi:hypothetical protein
MVIRQRPALSAPVGPADDPAVQHPRDPRDPPAGDGGHGGRRGAAARAAQARRARDQPGRPHERLRPRAACTVGAGASIAATTGGVSVVVCASTAPAA